MIKREPNKDYDTLENIEDVIDEFCNEGVCGDNYCGWRSCDYCVAVRAVGFEKCNEIWERNKGDVWALIKYLQRYRYNHSL